MQEKERLKCRRRLFSYAKRRALKKNREFSLNLDDIIIPDYCPVLGIKMEHGGDPRNSPSIERINRDAGYIRSNIIVISYCANVVRHLATPDEIIQVGKFFRDHPSNKENRKSKLFRELQREKEKTKKLKLAFLEVAKECFTSEQIRELNLILDSL